MMIAVGLGYSCHLTLKMAQILGLPLRHPVDHRGSKSVIYDQVHSKLADKDREFFTSTPEGTALSRTSPNGSSIGTNLTPAFVGTSANGDVNKSQGSGPGHQHSKASDLSEEGSTGTNAVDNSASKTKGAREQFDESEYLFKPASDDHFFRVDSSFMEEFNSSGEGGENHRHADSQARMEDQENSALPVSTLIQIASEGTPKTFQLVRGKRFSHRHEGKMERDKNNSRENGLLDDTDAEDSDEDVHAGGDVHVDELVGDSCAEKRYSTSSGSELGDGDDSGDVAHLQPPARVSGYSIGSADDENSPPLTDVDAALLKEDG